MATRRRRRGSATLAGIPATILAPSPPGRTITVTPRWIILLVVAVAGCGPADPKLYPVTGSVVFEGKPAAGFMVEFSSQAAETKGLSASGQVAADGSFTLATRIRGTGRPGAVAGPHLVVVIPPPAAVVPSTAVLPVPIRYADYSMSTLTADVATEGPNDVRLALKR